MKIFLLTLLFLSPAFSQGDSASFDFWLGHWSLTWLDPDSSLQKGENTVGRILGGRVIREEFRGLTGQNAGFDGMSFSVFKAQDQRWHQTWVDNQGGYLDFVGGTTGERRFFQRAALGPNGKAILQRMVFYNIGRERFDWDWEVSNDEGKSWQLRWRIHYERMKN